MPRTTALLGRLLPLLAPVASLSVAGAAGCGKAGPPGPIEPASPAKSFDAASPPSPVATTPPRQLPPCSSVFFVKANPLRTGGPYRLPACYLQSSVSGAAACLPGDSPRLAEAVPGAQYAECVERGPEPQKDKATGAPTCCYVLGAMGEGRPLLIMVAKAGSTAEAAPRLRRVVARLALASPENTWT